jgi:hypothetical protein
MEAIKSGFRARCREITSYLDLLQFVEESGSNVVSRDGAAQFQIDTTTRHVLKASVFVHLYNLVESTVTECLSRVAQEIRDSGLTYRDINEDWQKCWLREIGQTAEVVNPDVRLRALLRICNDVLRTTPITVKPKISGGSLDDSRIERLLGRHGVCFPISTKLQTAIKKHVVDDNGPLKLVRIRRNELAHGLSSFGDCGRSVSIRDLRDWTAVVLWYLKQLISEFDRHLKSNGFKAATPATDAPAVSA